LGWFDKKIIVKLVSSKDQTCYVFNQNELKFKL